MLTRRKLVYFIGLWILLIFSLTYHRYSRYYNLNIELEKTDNFIYDEAFLAYLTKSHVNLLEVLLKSIHHFSTRPIIVYSIDFDLKLSANLYPRLKTHRISGSRCGDQIFICKPFLIYNAPIKYGVYVDIDTVVNHNIDVLFDVIKSWNRSHVLAPIHWYDPENTNDYIKRYKIEKKTVHYVHAGMFYL